jgi:hypothetical protein
MESSGSCPSSVWQLSRNKPDVAAYDLRGSLARSRAIAGPAFNYFVTFAGLKSKIMTTAASSGKAEIDSSAAGRP